MLDQLNILNVNNPPGPDSVTPKLLKQISSSICKPLVKLYNKLLELKCLSYITPVFKGKGSADTVDNISLSISISLTSAICKIMEKIIFKYIYNFILENNILIKYQSGFQPNDSTVNQLLEIYNTIISNLDKGKDVRFIFL